MSALPLKADVAAVGRESPKLTHNGYSGVNDHPARPALSSITTAASSPPPGTPRAKIDWDNVGDNLDDEGKDAEIAAAAPRYCAVASLR